MTAPIKLMTSLGWVTVGSEIDIYVPKINIDVYASNNGAKNQTISTGGNLLGYPLGFERTHAGHIMLLYVVGLGMRSSIILNGERGLQCATNILNSFCMKAFKLKGINARAVNRKDFNVEYTNPPYGLEEDSALLKRIERSDAVIFENQQVDSKIKGTYWLASTSSRIKGGDLAFGVDCLEDGILKNETLVDTDGQAQSAKKQILALVRIKVDIRESMGKVG